MSVQLKTKIQPHRSSLYGVMECGVPLTPVMRNLLRAVTPVNHIAHFISSKMPGRRIGLLASPRTTNLYGQTGPWQRFLHWSFSGSSRTCTDTVRSVRSGVYVHDTEVYSSVRHGPGQPMGHGPGRATGWAGPEFWVPNGL